MSSEKERPNFTRTTNPRPHDRIAGRGNRGTAEHAQWGDVDAQELLHFTGSIVVAGGCVIYSRSSDGGVLSITVIIANERIRAYPRTGEEAIRCFHDILDELGI